MLLLLLIELKFDAIVVALTVSVELLFAVVSTSSSSSSNVVSVIIFDNADDWRIFAGNNAFVLAKRNKTSYHNYILEFKIKHSILRSNYS